MLRCGPHRLGLQGNSVILLVPAHLDHYVAFVGGLFRRHHNPSAAVSLEHWPLPIFLELLRIFEEVFGH